MASVAVEALVESIKKKEEPKGADVIPAEIRVRESTAAPPP